MATKEELLFDKVNGNPLKGICELKMSYVDPHVCINEYSCFEWIFVCHYWQKLKGYKSFYYIILYWALPHPLFF